MNTADLPVREPLGPGARRRLAPRVLAGVLVAAVVSVPLTVLTALVLSRSDGLRAWDLAVIGAVHDEVAVRPRLTRLLGWISVVTHPNTLRVVAAGVAVALWRRGLRQRAVWLGVTMAAGGALGPLLKVAVARARPAFEHPVALAPGYSFPSGHALSSMLFAACLVVLARRPTAGRPGRRAAVWAAAAALVLVTGADRIGLGVHYTTDVLAGWLVALMTVTATTTAFGLRRRPPPAAPQPPPEPGA